MKDLTNADFDFIEELNKQQDKERDMKTINLARTKVLQTIESAEGTYKVTFKKKDGTLRKMIARQNVEHNLKGGTNKVTKPSNDYLATFDVDAFAYRTINLATVTELKVNGQHYKVV